MTQRRIIMPRQIDWLSILVQCKTNVQRRISPLLATLNKPQPNLGIGAGGDPMRQVDLAAEKAIVETLRKHDLQFTLVSEESGLKKYGKNPQENYITTDPIDGTTNLTRGIPFYATSIAVSTKPTLETVHAALVSDLFHDVTYTAQNGKGAHRNGRKVTPSGNTLLEEAVIGIDINSYKVQKITSQLTRLIQRTKHIRHFGANALELCYVADGASDAFIDIRGKLRATDMAAAWLIIREAGARMTSLTGEPLKVKLDPKQKVEFVASANQEMHETILNLLRHEKEEE
jgi:myo-inositol-1(or 4)-monophosphatase